METDTEKQRDWQKNITESRKVPQRRRIGKGQSVNQAERVGSSGIYRELTN